MTILKSILSKIDHILSNINYYSLYLMGNEQHNVNVNTPIVVTGATGFLGENIIKILLEKGYYVKGTVRYLALKERYEHLRSLPGSDRLVFTEADLMDPSAWDKVFEGVDYVIHVAAPDPPYVPED